MKNHKFATFSSSLLLLISVCFFLSALRLPVEWICVWFSLRSSFTLTCNSIQCVLPYSTAANTIIYLVLSSSALLFYWCGCKRTRFGNIFWRAAMFDDDDGISLSFGRIIHFERAAEWWMKKKHHNTRWLLYAFLSEYCCHYFPIFFATSCYSPANNSNMLWISHAFADNLNLCEKSIQCIWWMFASK